MSPQRKTFDVSDIKKMNATLQQKRRNSTNMMRDDDEPESFSLFYQKCSPYRACHTVQLCNGPFQDAGEQFIKALGFW